MKPEMVSYSNKTVNSNKIRNFPGPSQRKVESLPEIPKPEMISYSNKLVNS